MLFLFEDFVLDTDRRELRGGGGLISVEPQVFDLLVYLVENRDRVVSRDEILDAIWDGRAVSPSVLSTRINAARSAVGDSGEAQRLIKTLPRKGVRFVGTIREEGAPPAPSVAAVDGAPAGNRPSIAVLPFENFCEDPGQDYFADGMVEEIVTALSHMRWLMVSARNSTFAYKGRSVDIRQIGRDLDVRYVLEGSVRRSAGRVRITAQLIDATTGMHLWADRFEGDQENLFELQDQVAARVIGAIAPRLGEAEIDRAKRKPTESLDAYDYYLRGMAGVHRWSRDANEEAMACLYRAIELDPDFAAAYGLLARCYSQRKSCGWVADRARETGEAERLARIAAELGKDDAIALCMAGIVLGYVVGDLEDGDRLIDRAIRLNSNLAWVWTFGSWIKIWLGEPAPAVERGDRAVELSPNDPEVLFYTQTATAFSHFLTGDYDRALTLAQAAMRQRPHFQISTAAAATVSALAGRLDEARAAMATLRTFDPDLRIADLGKVFPFLRPDDAMRWAEGLRQAGLPE